MIILKYTQIGLKNHFSPNFLLIRACHYVHINQSVTNQKDLSIHHIYHNRNSSWSKKKLFKHKLMLTIDEKREKNLPNKTFFKIIQLQDMITIYACQLDLKIYFPPNFVSIRACHCIHINQSMNTTSKNFWAFTKYVHTCMYIQQSECN